MFEDFFSFAINTDADDQVSIYGVKSASIEGRPPLLLLHGFPQNHRIWHKVAPSLVERYTVIALDLRGYGESSKPEPVSAYAKSLMARDCVRVMEHLGFNKFFICAHDRGARVSQKICVDYPDRVMKAIFLDICPTMAMYNCTNAEFPKMYFHWYFLIQKEPLPETLVSTSARRFAELFMGRRQPEGIAIFDPEAFQSYVQQLEDSESIHAMCQDYRASATIEIEEARQDLREGRLINCPLLVLWGKHGVIEQCFDAVKEWRAVANEGVLVDGRVVESGHYLAEHMPSEIVEAIFDFLR